MVRISPDGTNRWTAWDGATVAGHAAALVRPDGRCHLRLADCRAAAYRPLVAAVATALRRDLYIQVPAGEHEELARLADAGFTAIRREIHYLIPTDSPVARRLSVPVPSGFELVSAADADLDRLRELDETLREDIPGSDGWRWTPEGFAEQTFSDGFDPQTYRVAVDRDGRYVALIRIWVHRDGPRFGMLGVLRRYRRTRIVVALGAAVLGVLADRGYREVWADIDRDNRASTLLVRRLGAREVGAEVELLRPA